MEGMEPDPLQGKVEIPGAPPVEMLAEPGIAAVGITDLAEIKKHLGLIPAQHSIHSLFMQFRGAADVGEAVMKSGEDAETVAVPGEQQSLAEGCRDKFPAVAVTPPDHGR